MKHASASEQKELTFWQVLGSIFASAVGVQKQANRERDFANGKPIHYVIGGVIFTVLFVVAVLVAVNIAIA